MSSEIQNPINVPTALGPETIATQLTDLVAKLPNVRVLKTCPLDVVLPLLADQTARSNADKKLKQRVAKRFIEFMESQNMHKLDIFDVAPPHVSEWLAVDRIRYNLGTRTVRNYIFALGVMFGAAFKAGLVSHNVVRLVKLPPPPRLASRRAFTDQELVATYLAGDEEWKEMILTESATGIRIGCISLLTVGDIDFIAGFLRPVGGNPTPLPQWLLERWKVKYGVKPADAPLFPRANKWMHRKGQLGSDRVSAEFKELLVRAGVRKPENDRIGTNQHSPLTFSGLRYTYVARLKLSNVSEAVARHLMGHHSQAVTRIYQHFEESTLKAMVDKLDNPLKALVANS